MKTPTKECLDVQGEGSVGDFGDLHPWITVAPLGGDLTSVADI